MWSSMFRIALIFCVVAPHTVSVSKNTRPSALIPQETNATFHKARAASTVTVPDVVPLTPIVLGQSATLVGSSKEYQQAINNGIAACIKEINANGGVLGRKIVLKILNNYNNPSTTHQNIQQLRSENIDLFIGMVGTRNIKAIISMVQEKEIALFFPWGSSLDLDKTILPYMIHGQRTLKPHIQHLVSYLAGCQQHTNIGIIHSDSAFGITSSRYAEQLLKTFTTQDVTVKVTSYPYNSRDAETDHIIKAINEDKPHALMFLSSGRPTSKIVKGIWAKGNYVQDLVGLESNFSVPSQINNSDAHFRYTRCVPSITQKEYPIVQQYLAASALHLPGQTPNTLSLMYYINTRLLAQAFEHIIKDKKPITKDTAIAALEKIRNIDLGGFIGDFDRNTRTLYPIKISLEEGVA